MITYKSLSNDLKILFQIPNLSLSLKKSDEFDLMISDAFNMDIDTVRTCLRYATHIVKETPEDDKFILMDVRCMPDYLDQFNSEDKRDASSIRTLFFNGHVYFIHFMRYNGKKESEYLDYLTGLYNYIYCVYSQIITYPGTMEYADIAGVILYDIIRGTELLEELAREGYEFPDIIKCANFRDYADLRYYGLKRLLNDKKLIESPDMIDILLDKRQFYSLLMKKSK